MGWGNPGVIISLVTGGGLLIAFPFIEMHVADPMFRLELFKIRMFSAANLAGLLGAMARGGLMIMLIILLQGIWLPLHGYSFEVTPFWAGIFMIPLSIGTVITGPISGWLSDRHGARLFATLGMVIIGTTLIALTFLPSNFDYLPFATILFIMGIGNGVFFSPNTASIMNAAPPEHRGAASGMRATLQNCGQTISLAVFFTIVIVVLSSSLPAALSSAVANAGPGGLQVAQNINFAKYGATGALFAAFLGYNPIKIILSAANSTIINNIPSGTIQQLTSSEFFPTAISSPFMTAFRMALYVGAIMCFAGAAFSALRGRKYIHGQPEIDEEK
jgi:MFS family permease